MKRANENRHEYDLRLHEYADGSFAWGTQKGSEAFTRIDGLLASLGEGTLVALNYEGIKRTDVSFQREAVVETIRKHRPRLLFVGISLSDLDVRANLESALERRGESLLLRDSGGELAVVGRRLTEEHEATLRTLQGCQEFTSGMLTVEPFRLESSTASARLSALWKAGLVARVQGAAPSGGKEYKYFPIK